MTAIGALSANEPMPTADEVGALDEATLAAYTADAIAWVRGPYTGAVPVTELRRRTLVALVALQATFRADPADVPPRAPGHRAILPGSVDDPAYSSPTPVAGDRIEVAPEPGDEATVGGEPTEIPPTTAERRGDL